jgi:hypothetical protein
VLHSKSLRLGLAALTLATVACSRDEKATPTPEGPQAQELELAGATMLIGAGDIAVCGTSGDEATGALVDSLLAADSAKNIPSIVATFGDNAYPSGSQGIVNDFPRCFSPSWGRPRIMRVIHTSPGNHDYDDGTGQPYFAYFGDKAGPPGKGYYSYDVGGWHIISLNSELYFEAGDQTRAKAQEDWLRNDLAQHRTVCALAYFHRPYFTSGKYRSTQEVKPLIDILFAGGVDLVLNGHEHDYERFIPQTPAGVADSINGIEQVVAGTGGGVLRAFQYPLAPNSASQIQGRFGVLKVALGSGEYSHAFIDTDGKVWDPVRRKCH